MDNKGQLAGWEAAIIIILFLGCGLLAYLWATKETEKNQYLSGSNPTISDVKRTDWPFSIHIGEGGCARFDPLKPSKDSKLNVIMPLSINSEKK